jgi:putative FmdB family regulatory protein
MPIYEFKCGKCRKDFEELVYGGNVSKIKCPKCGSKKVEKKMSLFGFKSGSTFKSSGSGHSCGSCSSSSCNTCSH